MLEHYLKCFVNKKQINWINLLFLTEFVNNNNLHNFASVTLFYLMYEYHSKIRYKVENNFFEEKILSTKDRVEQLQNLWKNFEKRLKRVAEYQTKYYNKNHKSRKFIVGELILLSIKNFNQKCSSKKMFLKFTKSFKIENKIKKQTYWLTLSSTYHIHNVFFVFLLKSYYHKADDKNAHEFMQVSNLINDNEQWKVKKIVDRMKIKENNIWYQMKWVEWNKKYNQWLFENKLNNATNLKNEFNEKMKTSKKRKRK